MDWLAVAVCKAALVVLRRLTGAGHRAFPGSVASCWLPTTSRTLTRCWSRRWCWPRWRVPAGATVSAKDSLFNKPVVGRWFRAAGHVEVDRAAGRAGCGEAVSAARNGRLLQ